MQNKIKQAPVILTDRGLAKFIVPIINLFYELLHTEYIILSSSVHPISHNWGDDMSKKIVSLINPKAHIIQRKYSWNIRKKDDYLCIGSILSWMTTANSIVWGAGVVYPDKPMKNIPKQVLAVRGPLSREYLLKQGVPCPKIYGDPALLFPRFYQPKKTERKFRIGIIPHMRDLTNPIIKDLISQNGVKLIDVTDIRPWHKFIDDICSCECICSSSLHGIIVADAYKVPNVWIEILDGERKRFAFWDYLQSVGRTENEGFLVNSQTDIQSLINECKKWNGITIDLDKLISVCPFINQDKE